ncbi:MAG: glycosyltransferase family 39 protein [Chloroflexota bacterium]
MLRFQLLIKAVGFFLIILLCELAQSQFLGGFASGYLWLAAGGVLAFALLVPAPAASLAAQDTGSLELTSGLWRWLGILLLIIGLVILVSSASLFQTQLLTSLVPNEDPWIQYGVGLILALLGGLLLGGIGRIPRPDVTVLILVGLFAAALFVRVVQVDQYPFGVWYDEALWGLNARSMFASPAYRPIFVDNIFFPHLALYAIGLRTFGDINVLGMRIVNALLASLGVIAAYLVGRELRGKWFGLAMAALLAALRWSIDFSRIALPGPENVTFVLFAFYALLRFVRRGHLRDAIWLGLITALGLYFYRSYQMQIVAIVVYLLLTYPFLRRRWKGTLTLWFTGLLTAVIILIPAILFIANYSDVFLNRLDQVSIFTESRPDDVTLADSLSQSTVRHLEMFHLAGDNNGRHNLPGAPMLDPVTGSLFALGLFVALRERRREHLFFLVSLATAFASGILSVSFEAPQSLRSICAMVAVIYFAALGLEAMVRIALSWLMPLLQQPHERIARAAVGVSVLAVLGIMTAWNLYLYFNLQRTNLAVWYSYYATDTLIARSYASYSSDTRFFPSPLIGNSVPVQFIAPDALDRAYPLVMPDPFPLRVEATSPAVIVLLPTENFYMDYLHQLYPKAQFHPLRPVDYGVDDTPSDVLFTSINLSAQDIGAIQGLRDGRGVLYIPAYDTYTFLLAPNVQLEIDHQVVSSGTPIQLAEGNHAIAVTPPDAALRWQLSNTPAALVPAQFLYHDPVVPNGLVASFYANADYQGTPVTQRIYPFVYWQIQVLPMDRPYSVRYDGYLYAPVSGQYQLFLNAIDHAELDLDGAQVINTITPNLDTQAIIALEPGWHPIEVRFQDLTSNSRILLSWMLPDTNDTLPITRDYFCPALDICPTPP